MTAKRTKSARTRRNVLTATLARFIDASRVHPALWLNGAIRFPLLADAQSPAPLAGPDPVSVAVFAIDRVGPAAVRASASGQQVRIAVTDEATAAVIRAALAQTARRRPTDRLIQVVTG